ncbi:MAG: hypothetical protein AAFN78_04645 [Pseudomonadota bacterium]
MRNGLHRVAAGGAVLVGIFLLMGAAGHFEAVLPVVNDPGREGSGFALLVPGLILAAAGLFSVSLCKALWDARRWGINVALTTNALALVYLLYLMWRGVPDHPVALFTGIVACNLLVLVATRAGLVWPAQSPSSGEDGKGKR